MAYTKVVIIGGGFGGLNAAQKLKKADVDLLLIDRNNYHLFQPLLYQVATAALSPANIASPIRQALKNQENATVLMANVEAVDKEKRQIFTSGGDTFDYDYLVVATGARHCYFGHPEWERYAPGLKTINDATRIRERILLSFELAERCDSISEREKYLRFVIVGGGPTGVELAGAVAEIAHKTLFHNFRRIKPEHAQIYLIEGQPEVLKTFHPKLGQIAHHYLEKMGVNIIPSTHVTDVVENGVYIGERFLESFSIIWAAGNHAAPLLETLDTPLDKSKRAIVGPDLTVPGHPELFIIGDSANAKDKKGAPLPGLAPVAIQQGRYVADLIRKKVAPETRKPFRYRDKGTMATVGKAKAVVWFHGVRLHGFPAWLLWSYIHIMYLMTFGRRIIVAFQWAFTFLTGSRQVRIINHPIFGAIDSIFKKSDDGYEFSDDTFHISKRSSHEKTKEPRQPLQ